MNAAGLTLALPAWLPLVALACGLVVLALFTGGLAVALWLRKSSRQKPAITIAPEAGFPAEGGEGGAAGGVSGLGWGRETRRGPCILVTGDARSGATSLIDGLAGTAPRRFQGVSWRAFQGGLLFDVPGETFLGPGIGKWEHALRMLGRRRPSRPLDGIVVTMSAAALSGAARSRDAEILHGQGIRQRLDRLRERLGFILPVYVVITQCDELPGFAGFALALDEAGRSDGMIGWSAGRRLDAAFSADWIGEAFACLGEALGSAGMALVGGGVSASRRPLLLFPGHLARLRTAIEWRLEPIFRSAASGDPHILRGIYFCGRHGEEGPPLFVKDLFDTKIFRETRLATAAGGGAGPRRRWSLAGKVSAAALAVVLGAGSWIAYQRLAWVRDTHLEPLLDDLSRAVAEGSGRDAAAPARAFNFLATVEALDVDGFYSAFFPRSWSDPIGARMQRVLGPAFQELVVETCRRGLEDRIERLSREPSRRRPASAGGNAGEETGAESSAETSLDAGGEIEAPAAAVAVRFEPNWILHLGEKYQDDPRYVALEDFLGQAAALERNLIRYERLRDKEEPGFSEVNRLLEYLSGQRFAHNAELESNRRYRRILAGARWPAVRRREEFLDRASARTGELASAFLTAWIGESPLPDAIAEVADQVNALEQSIDGGDTALERLEGSIDGLSAALETGRWDWAAAEEFDRGRWEVFGKAIEQAPFANEELLEAIDADGERQMELLGEALRQASGSSGGSIVDLEPGKLRVTASVRALGAAVSRLRSFSAVTRRPAVSATGSAALGHLWNTAELREVAGVENAYTAFARDTVPALPGRFRAPLRRIAAARVRAAAVAALLRARTPNPAPYREGGDPERTLLPEIRNLGEAAGMFAGIARGLDAMGAPAERENLRRLLAAQAVELLRVVGRELDRNPAYRPRLAQWDETAPLSLALYEAGSKPDLRRFLDSERARIGALASHYAQPLLDALDAIGADPGREHSERWREIDRALAAYAAAKPGNAVHALESLIEEGLDRIRPDAGCAAAPAPGGADLFASAGRVIRDRGVTVCTAALLARYQRIADLFNTRLAGRYPFTMSAHPGEGPGADPRDANELFRMSERYGAALEGVLSTDRQFGDAGTKAAEFLRRVAAIRPLFLSGEEQTAPAVAVSAEFRVNRTGESNANQIIDWVLRLGDQSTRGGGAPAEWRYGDRASMEFRYAKDSPLSPVSAAGGPIVDGRQVRFDFLHPWALIQMLREHAADPDERAVPTASNIVRFRIPTAGRLPEAPAREGPAQASVVFLRLELQPKRTRPGSANLAGGLEVSGGSFPVRAPSLARSGNWDRGEKWSGLR